MKTSSALENTGGVELIEKVDLDNRALMADTTDIGFALWTHANYLLQSTAIHSLDIQVNMAAQIILHPYVSDSIKVAATTGGCRETTLEEHVHADYLHPLCRCVI